MNRLKNLNKKFKKEIKNALENRVAYPKILKEGIQKLMATGHESDGEKGFSPLEVFRETGMNVNMLYRWRYQALNPNGTKHNSKKTSKKKVTKKEVSKNPSKKKSKAYGKFDSKSEYQEFKDALAEEICRSHIIAQLKEISDYDLKDMKDFEIDELQKTVTAASLLIESAEELVVNEESLEAFLKNKREMV